MKEETLKKFVDNIIQERMHLKKHCFVPRFLGYSHPISRHNYGKCFAMTIENLIIFYNVGTVRK